MKVAVTYKDGNVFEHFGHSEEIKIYEIENNKIKSSNIVDTSSSGHGELIKLLIRENVNVVICGGIGNGAINALSDSNIELYSGQTGNVDSIIDKFIRGELISLNNTCNHDDEHHCNNHDSCRN